MRRAVVDSDFLRAQEEVVLPPEVVRHLRDSLRLGPGALIELLDGLGRYACAEIIASDRHGLKVLVSEVKQAELHIAPRLTLFQGLGKGDKMEAVVRQTTELGVDRIVPLETDRVEGQRSDRRDRWRRVADDAVRLSGRYFRPEILPPQALETALAEPRAEQSFLLSPGAPRSLKASLGYETAPLSVELLVGPEGGFSRTEVEMAESAGFTPAHFGEYTLRTETAGPAVVAALRFWFAPSMSGVRD
jgi:16S rRNA (uracil1498-N3)-methyltransferase